MPTACSDCGQTATGVYDLAPRPSTEKELEKRIRENPSLATDYDRPLCDRDARNRGLISGPALPKLAAAPAAPTAPPRTPAERLAELDGEA